VKSYRGPDAKLRLWFKPGEIDDWMEAALHKADLFPTERKPSVDIECFVDRHLNVSLEQYASLEPTVLGQTRFEPGKEPRICINKSLTELAVDAQDPPAWLRSKWRMTMAHEATHVMLHRCLYASDPAQGMLFGADDEPSPEGRDSTYQCLERNLATTKGSDWREIQANKGMAALLMPKSFFLLRCQSQREALAIESKPLLKDSDDTDLLSRHLCQQFDVSFQSVLIRLQELKLFGMKGQLELL
jgi:hypothetical protein